MSQEDLRTRGEVSQSEPSQHKENSQLNSQINSNSQDRNGENVKIFKGTHARHI